MKNEDIVFAIFVEDVQQEAERLVHRRLTDDEIHSVRKSLGWGLTWDLDVVCKIAIEIAVQDDEAEKQNSIDNVEHS
jgi:hypothetical protein